MTTSAHPQIASLGVLLDQSSRLKRWSLGLNVFEGYITELLAHAGIPHRIYSSTQEAIQASPDILIAAVVDSDRITAHLLWEYAEQGGTLISYGGLNLLAAKLGFIRTGDRGKGYAKLPDGLYTADRTLRYLSAEPWIRKQDINQTPTTQPDYGDAIGVLHQEHPDGAPSGPALQRFAIGSGQLLRWSVAALQTIVGLQQGSKPVLEDGVPAPDGTAAVNDAVLKADDVAELDWLHDRQPTPAGELYFAHPYADLWKEVLVSHLLHTASLLGLTLPFIDYWPDGVKQLALLSLDSDHTQDEEGMTTLHLLEECEVAATWCMMAPWYSPALYEQIESSGHELALHYNAVLADKGSWSEEAFREQAVAMRASAEIAQARIVSNKNHLTRIEGWGQLFEWCEQNGIESEQSRGNSKKGSVGYLFGTAHPYFPMAWNDDRNRFYNVLQIGFHYGDFLQCDPSIIRALLEQTVRVRGVAHFVFHQIHIHRKEPIRAFLREYVATAKQMGFTFWTGSQINTWERNRREWLNASLIEDGTLYANKLDTQLLDAVLWIPCKEDSEMYTHKEIRFGMLCGKQLIRNRK